MPPAKIYSSWNQRKSDATEQIEPYRKYFFICEGSNTEVWYFKQLIDNRKKLKIKSNIDIRLLEKTGKDKTNSHPKRLIAFAEQLKNDPAIAFDKERDKMVIVFDADIFEGKETDYKNLLFDGEKNNNLLGVTNPSFELFLLLHYNNAFNVYIHPNEKKILENDKDKNRRYIHVLFSDVSGMNPKKNKCVGELAEKIDIAIAEEQFINEDIHKCQGNVTCNLAKIINDIRSDSL